MRKIYSFCPMFTVLACLCIPAVAQVSKPDTTARKNKVPDYSHLLSFPEFHTNIFGKVERFYPPSNTQIYAKGKLFSDSFHLINHGAKFELLNENLTPAKNHERILVKILSNPPTNQYAGDTGWIYIGHTSLNKFYDRAKNMVDTNFLYNTYLNAAAKCRADAAKTKCSANKKCLIAWAEYYDCMLKDSRSDSPAPCPVANCTMEDCPADK